MRSLGGLAANLTLQVWQRAHALHRAALARNNDGPLRFLEPSLPTAAAIAALPGWPAPA
jgi:cobalt/nickel transport system permease protein